jgi:hypothetical protein
MVPTEVLLPITLDVPKFIPIKAATVSAIIRIAKAIINRDLGKINRHTSAETNM